MRATWRGTIGIDSPALPEGSELAAHIAALLTVSGGLVTEHETFDCYEPLPGASGASG